MAAADPLLFRHILLTAEGQSAGAKSSSWERIYNERREGRKPYKAKGKGGAHHHTCSAAPSPPPRLLRQSLPRCYSLLQNLDVYWISFSSMYFSLLTRLDSPHAFAKCMKLYLWLFRLIHDDGHWREWGNIKRVISKEEEKLTRTNKQTNNPSVSTSTVTFDIWMFVRL